MQFVTAFRDVPTANVPELRACPVR
jgi:hypothetical protein